MDYLLWKGLKSTGKSSQFEKMVELLKSAKAPQWGAEILNFQRYMLDPMPTLSGIRGKFNLRTAISKFSNDVSAFNHVIELEE